VIHSEFIESNIKTEGLCTNLERFREGEKKIKTLVTVVLALRGLINEKLLVNKVKLS
jgi:hypothetical protein